MDRHALSAAHPVRGHALIGSHYRKDTAARFRWYRGCAKIPVFFICIRGRPRTMSREAGKTGAAVPSAQAIPARRRSRRETTLGTDLALLGAPEQVQEAVLVLPEHAELVKLLLQSYGLGAIPPRFLEHLLEAAPRVEVDRLLRLPRGRFGARRGVILVTIFLGDGFTVLSLALHALHQFEKSALHSLAVLLEVGHVDFDPRERREDLEHGLGGLGVRDAGGEEGDLAQEAGAVDPVLQRGSEDHAVEAPDLAVLECGRFELQQVVKDRSEERRVGKECRW